MGKKFFIPLYAEYINFLIKRCGWIVTRIYSHYTFEQSTLIMNKVSRQNSKNSVEKGFLKLMSNSNFGYDCRNNADNCFFPPISDETEELSYVKCYQSSFDPEVSEFRSSHLLEREINETFANKICRLDPNDQFFQARKNSLETEKQKQFDAAHSMKISKKKGNRKNTVKEIDEKVKDFEKDPKSKTLIEFDFLLACRQAEKRLYLLKI